MSTKAIYVSVDIEADGLVPGLNSMLSLGAASFTIEKELIATFSANLEPLDDAEPYAKTMEWWRQFPEAWKEVRRDPQAPEGVMRAFGAHLGALSRRWGRLVFMAYPASFDFAWINWYFRRFTGSNPFGASGLCLRSYGAGMLECSYPEAEKERFPAHWFDGLPHTHVALDDALEQGAMGINMLRESWGLPRIGKLVDRRSENMDP
jgi:hypothetical protein